MNAQAAKFWWWRSRWAKVIAAVVLAYTVIGFLVLPAVIKWQMHKLLPGLTKRAAAVRQVRLNPYALSLTIRGLALTESNGEPFAGFEEFHVNVQLWSSLFHRAFVFREIRLRKPSGHVVWNADGTFNFSNLLPAAAPPPEPTAETGLPRVVIGLLSIEEGALAFADLTRGEPIRQDYQPINVRLTNLSTLPGRDSPYSIVAITPAGGKFEWSGNVSINPVRSAGAFTLTGSALKTYSAYAAAVARIQITGGELGVRAEYSVALADGQPDVAVSNLVVTLDGFRVEPVEGGPPAKLAVDGLRVSVSDARYRGDTVEVDEIKIAGMKAAAALLALPSGGPSSREAIGATDSEKDSRELVPPVSEAKPLTVSIGAVVFEDVAVRLTDESIAPPVTAAVDGFSGSIRGLTSTLNSAATVNLAGKINGVAPFTVSGKVNPLASELFVDVAVALKDNALLPTSPYAAKFAGYGIEQGTLSLDLRYHVTQSQLEAENKVKVDQFRFGTASGSPDALKLPVKLGVALLQDRHGVIKLDVPVRGRLDDPEFRLGKVIVQVFMNVITKAITKPFSMLASLVPGMGDTDLSFVAFEPGRADFAAGEVDKLDALATALYERPALALEATGTVDPAQDRPALAKLALERQAKERVIAELPAKQRATVSVATVLLDPQDYERLVWKIYTETMATGQSALPAAPCKQNFAAARQKKSATPTSSGSGGALTVADMEAQLLAAVPVGEADLRTLAESRAQKVQAYLTQTGKVEAGRLSLAQPKLPTEKGQCRAELGVK